MGSVTTSIQCPNCGAEAIYEEWYNSQEQAITCIICGYDRTHFLKEDANGKPIQNPDGTYQYVNREVIRPYGCFYVRYKNGAGWFCSVESERHYQRLMNKLNEIKNSENEVESVTLSSVQGGVNFIKDLLHNTSQFKPVETMPM